MNNTMGSITETPSVEMTNPIEVNVENIKPDMTLDVSNLMCPLPGVKTFKKIAELKSGQVLEVKSTNSILKKFAPMMIKSSSHQWLGFAENNNDGYFRFYLRKA